MAEVIESGYTADVVPVVKSNRSATSVDARVGLRVKLRRTELGLSQDKVAAQLGITAQQLQKYERGANRIGAGRLHEIAKILNTSILYFFKEMNSGDGDDADGESGLDESRLAQALEDATTVRFLKIFATVDDAQLRSKMLGIVEAVVDSNLSARR